MSQYIVILLCQTPDKLMWNYSDTGTKLYIPQITQIFGLFEYKLMWH